MNYEAIPFPTAEGNRLILFGGKIEGLAEDLGRETSVVVDEGASGREA